MPEIVYRLARIEDAAEIHALLLRKNADSVIILQPAGEGNGRMGCAIFPAST